MDLNFSVGKPKANISERDRVVIEKGGAIAERKWDGSRMIGIVGQEISLLSRSRSTVTNDFISYAGKFPHIVKELKSLQLPFDTILDGEIVMLNAEDSSVEDFDAIKAVLNSKDERARTVQKEKGLAHWILFDILRVGGKSLLHRFYVDRRKWLASLVPSATHIHLVEQIPFETLAELEERLPTTNWEGFVIKLWDSSYEIHDDPTKTKRMSGWWKLRLDREMDLVISGFDYGQGKFQDVVGSLRCGIFDQGRYLHVCNVGGMTDEQRVSMLSTNYPRVASIKFSQTIASKKNKRVKYVDDGRERIVDVAPFSLRFPSFLRWHIDKSVDECILSAVSY